jgi:hypothetical protein
MTMYISINSLFASYFAGLLPQINLIGITRGILGFFIPFCRKTCIKANIDIFWLRE